MSQVSKNMTIYQQNTMSLSLKKPYLKHYSSCFDVRTTTHNALIIIAQQELSIHVTKIVTHLNLGPKNRTYINEDRNWKIRYIWNIECIHLTAMMMDEFNLKYYSSCYSDRTTIRHTLFERAKQNLSIHVTKIVTHLKCGPINWTCINEYRNWKIRYIWNNECLHHCNLDKWLHLTAMMMNKSNSKHYSSCYSNCTTIRYAPLERAQQELSIHVLNFENGQILNN